jgi:hypothetical protein
MSKRSQAKRSGNIAKQLTFFAAGFPANPQASPESEKEPPIIAGSGLTFCAWCLKSNPCLCWRKILAESLHFALKECNSANGLRVSLRLEVTNCSPSSWLLKTLAHRSEESEFSLWPTAAACNPNDGEKLDTWLARRELLKATAQNGNGCGTPLSIAVQMWPTPTVCGNNNRAGSSPKAGNGLATEAKIWATPNRTDAKGGSRKGQGQEQLCFQVKKTDGQPDPDSPNTNGKNRALLNPRWVAQLQGFPSDWLDGIEWPL